MKQTQRHTGSCSVPIHASLTDPRLSPGNGFPCSLLLPLDNTPSFDDIQSLLWFFFCRRYSNSSLEIEDEPPCAEEIDYNTDSCSDGEGDFSELDQEIQECLSWVEVEAEDEGETTGQTCSSKALRGLYISNQPASSNTALPLSSAPLGAYSGFESSPAWARLWLWLWLLMFVCLPASASLPDVLLQFCIDSCLYVCVICIHVCTENVSLRQRCLLHEAEMRSHWPQWYCKRTSSFPKQNPHPTAASTVWIHIDWYEEWFSDFWRNILFPGLGFYYGQQPLPTDIRIVAVCEAFGDSSLLPFISLEL